MSSGASRVWRFSDDDTIEAAFGSAQSVTDTGGTTDAAETSAVTIGGTPTGGDYVIFQVFRDADNGSDTLAVNAKLLGVGLFYTINAATDA